MQVGDPFAEKVLIECCLELYAGELSGEVPSVLRPDQDLYAVPALCGATATALLLHFGLYYAWTGLLAALGAITFRLLAHRYQWHAPLARHARE